MSLFLTYYYAKCGCTRELLTVYTVVFSPDRVSKLRAPCTKCTVLYSEKLTENKADICAYG